MIFLLTLAFSAALIALGVGVAFIVWGYRNEGVAVTLACVFGYIITILAGVVLLSLSYFGVSYASQDYFRTHAVAQTMSHETMQCPMMKKMQKMKQEMQKMKSEQGKDAHKMQMMH